MIPVQILLIGIGALLADADECNCQCDGNSVCEEQSAMRTEQDALRMEQNALRTKQHALRREQNELRSELDVNNAELAKWNRHYNFVRSLAKDWQSQVAQVVRQQLEAGRPETVEGSIVPVQNEDLIARMGNLEDSLQSLHERADELDLTMEMISGEISGIRTELLRMQYGTRCGVEVDNDLIKGGGNTSSVHVWPWMAAVYRKDPDYYGYICGGSVIHRYFVLTSAYCLHAYGRDGLSVKLGLSDLKKKTHLQKYAVQSIHIHPEYKNEPYNNLQYNIALLKLEKPIQFGPFIQPICLPPRGIPQDDLFYKPQSTAKAVYIEYYLETPRTAVPTVLNLTILPEDACKKKLEENGWEKHYISLSSTFCAENDGIRCPYIGSPLMQSRQTEDGFRTWTQVGIRILEIHCKYFISSRIDGLMREWIDDTIADSFKQQ